jgi:tetraacyldisaccharide 4'-kinase
MISGESCSVAELTHVVAVAGIGHPPRFFAMLEELGTDVEQEVAFADHQKYELASLSALTPVGQTLLMTEKDAVKCHAFAQPNWWYLPVDAVLSSVEAEQLLKKIETLMSNRHKLVI